MVWVTPQTFAEQSSDVVRTLTMHRLPDHPALFDALANLFAGGPKGSPGLEAVNMVPIEQNGKSSSFRQAKVTFRTPRDAEAAFLGLPAVKIQRDNAGRPQKQVALQLAGMGASSPTLVYIRTAAIDLGAQACAPLPPLAGDGTAGETVKGAVPPRAWPGWKRAVDEELAAAGGALPWKRLRTRIVGRHRICGGGRQKQTVDAAQAVADAENGALGLLSLAGIPDHYLSKTDAFVRLPSGAESAEVG